MRSLFLSVLVSLALFGAAQAGGPELVYVHEAGCPYCRLFDERIAPVYPRTQEGARAPLRPIEKRAISETPLKLQRPVRYTPTFILIRDEREIGRIEGYPGEDFFWSMLSHLLERLPSDDGTARKVTTQ